MAFDLTVLSAAFLDAAGVSKKVAAAERRVLAKFGAFVRQRAKTSIRKRKKPSEPGSPPSSHAGDLRRLIFFAVDPAAESVVVGPVPFKGRSGTPPAEVTRLLEEGGSTTRPGGRGGRVVAHYRPRPYMAPAFAAEAPKFAALLAGMIQ